jgi:zinc transport system permease protein|tara:strand:+ start:1303 stop:2109 length:807 start_codon:yes stop_codon:yes gene_type:complete
MFDDFFIRALIAGIGIAIIAGPIGCFVVWRRLAYYGDTLAHSGLLGVTLGFILGINMSLSVFVISTTIAFLLLLLQKKTKLTGDALLGLLAHSSLAIGLVIIAVFTSIRIDLLGLLFGDILSVSNNDIMLIWGGGAVILLVLFLIWKSLFAATVNYDLAKAEGMNPDISNYIFTILIAGVIAISIKMIGVLLITGLLLIPPAMSRNFSLSPKEMVIFSVIGGVISVIIGLFGSLEFNTPSGPTIIVVSLILFFLSLFFRRGHNSIRLK